MSHIPVSVIIAAGGGADDLYACLESLRPSLGLRDEVVCVVPTDRADLHEELLGRTWLTVVKDDSGAPAQRWACGIAATKHPVLVLLDGDIVLSAHWLDPVLEPFEDGQVVAVGPRCHLSYGPQAADVPEEARDSIAKFKAYAREWRQEHRGRFTDVDRLGPVLVAVRRDALTLAGGPTADMPYEALHEQGRLVVAHGSLVAHVASEDCALRESPPSQSPPPRGSGPLLSASLIVKDEEDVLASCLAALRDVVDEIVVYDTGSTDRSLEIAREYGAKVIEGYWSDHFGDARNRSLAHCRGEWILWVDADEVVNGDAVALRARISEAPERAFLIAQENREGHDGSRGSTAILYPRLFRRATARIYGRLHEQVVDRITGLGIGGPVLRDIALDHSGYTVLRNTVKDKGSRNLRLAELATDDLSGLHALSNLARSQLAMGKAEEAIQTCRSALPRAVDDQHRITFVKVLISAQVKLGQLDEANESLLRLRGVTNSRVTADEHEAQIRFIEGDYERTLEIIQNFPETATNDLLYVVSRDQLTGLEIDSLCRLGRQHEAAQRLRDRLRAGQLPVSVAKLAEVLAADGGGVAEVADLLPHQRLRGLLFSVGEAPVEAADELLEALWLRYPGEAVILAVAARVGRQAPLIRAMEWSARLRRHGFGGDCTLLALSRDPRRAPRERTLAAAIALEMYGDKGALPLLAAALETVPDGDSLAVLNEMRILAPGIADSVELATT